MRNEKEILSIDGLVTDAANKGFTWREQIRIRLAYHNGTVEYESSHRLIDFKDRVGEYIQARKDQGYIRAQREIKTIIDEWHKTPGAK